MLTQRWWYQWSQLSQCTHFEACLLQLGKQSYWAVEVDEAVDVDGWGWVDVDVWGRIDVAATDEVETVFDFLFFFRMKVLREELVIVNLDLVYGR